MNKMKLIDKFVINLSIIIVFSIDSVINDCGLPAIPFNAQIDRVQHIYYEGEFIEYKCQLEELKLIGNTSRKCENSHWVGTIPRCVEELYFGTISAINLADERNDTLDYTGSNWYYRQSNAAYYADYKRDKCLSSTKMSRPHTWKLHLAKPKRHISYIEILIKDQKKQLMKTQVSKIVKYSKVNDLRECVSDLLESNDNTLRLSLTCLMEFEGDSKYEAWEKDQTQMITIEFDVNDITICEIRLYTNSFMPFHRCGSADIVLHSTMEFIKSGNKYSENSYYKYKCDEGFKLEGSEDVRCGLNNDWLDPFPTCKPVALCPFPPTKDESISLDIKFEHLFSFNGNISAIVGSVVSYECVGEHTNRSIMIGDSVRVCGTDGKWSGMDPICIHDYELSSDYFKDIENKESNDKQMTTFESFNKIVLNANQTSLACGIPSMPLFAKPTTDKSGKMFGGQADIRLYYANGTVINYLCESAYRWVTGDVVSRTCVNGKWMGRVGKCAINWGDKIRLYSVYTYDMDNDGKWINQHYVMETNSTSAWDEHFAYRRDADKGECATFTVDSKHKWSLRLNQSISITYFVVMFHPGGFFGSKHKINDPKILEKTPVTAEVGKKQCVLTSAWDYTHSKFGTFFFFTCDMDEPKYRYISYDYYINLYIDPKKFDSTYTAKNISLCSLAVMVSKEDCGSPDIPLHSSVTVDANTHEWTYSCDEGYQLNGSEKVSCGRNGRWATEFPTCEKKELCPNPKPSRVDEYLRISYDNTIKLDNKVVASIDSLAQYSCQSDPKHKNILIGSSLRACNKLGHWSGSEPYCMDPNHLPKSSQSESHSTTKVFTCVIAVIVLMVLISGIIYYAFTTGHLGVPAIRIPNFAIPRVNIQSETTADTENGRSDENGNAVQLPKEQSVPKHKSTKINEDLVTFSNGTEFLIETDTED